MVYKRQQERTRGAGKGSEPPTPQTLRLTSPTTSAPTCGQALSLSKAQTPRPGASRFSSAKFAACRRPVPAPCGRWRRDACLTRKGSKTFLKARLPFPVPGRFFPVAEGTLQILPTGFAPPLLYAISCAGCLVFSCEYSVNRLPSLRKRER